MEEAWILKPLCGGELLATIHEQELHLLCVNLIILWSVVMIVCLIQLF
jgi:hypothetical protein